MITFKQFLHEEDETDTQHESIEAAATEYLKHCSHFPSINHPLYRLSGDSWSRSNHKLKTRVPRTRRSMSLGGSGQEQLYVFSLPAWAEYPKRRQSIFCSTTQDFEIDEPADDGNNLLMIYPFDGVKIAMLDDTDLNTMNAFRGTSWKKHHITLDGIFDFVNDAYNIFRGTDLYNDLPDRSAPEEKIATIKKVFVKNGRFDSEANGNDEVADKYAEIEREDDYLADQVRVVALEIPEKLTPEAWGAKLVTSVGLDLPGATRECWFSGKYLSVPYRYHKEFKEEVQRQRKKA